MQQVDSRENSNEQNRPERDFQDREYTSREDMSNSNDDVRSGSSNQSDNSETPRRSGRGFAAMSPERQRQIASEGGRAAHKQGVAHEWSSDEARTAGRKGGQTVSQNREHMSQIGRRGGQSSGGRRSRNKQEDTPRGE